LRVSGWGVVLGGSGSVEMGWDKGDGLVARLSSVFPVLLVAELESGVPSRVCTRTLVGLFTFAAGGNSYRGGRGLRRVIAPEALPVRVRRHWPLVGVESNKIVRS
jgi:hypothetical protein